MKYAAELSESQVPIIMLTAKDDVSDKVAGLDTGADDYMTKPLRLKNVCKNRGFNRKKNQKDEAENLEIGKLN